MKIVAEVNWRSTLASIPYHVFRKKKLKKDGKPFYRWYYYYYDNTGKKIQKACKNCKNRSDAESYIRTLPPLENPSTSNPYLLLRDIAAPMYLPGSVHVERRRQLGKTTELETMIEARRYVEYIANEWGNLAMKDIEADQIINHLFTVGRSGSWKNRLISIFKEIYTEAPRYGCQVLK